MAPLFLPAVLVRDVPQVGGDPAAPLPSLPQTSHAGLLLKRTRNFYAPRGLSRQATAGVDLGDQHWSEADRRRWTDDSGHHLHDPGSQTDPATAVWECKGAM